MRGDVLGRRQEIRENALSEESSINISINIHSNGRGRYAIITLIIITISAGVVAPTVTV